MEQVINVPTEQAFTQRVEQLKSENGYDEALAAYIWARLSPGARSSTKRDEVIDAVKRRVDPHLVRSLREMSFKEHGSEPTP
jgi:hypothetical protein